MVPVKPAKLIAPLAVLAVSAIAGALLMATAPALRLSRIVDVKREGREARKRVFPRAYSRLRAKNGYHIRVVNFELGLPCPVLTTPLNFLGGGNDDE